MSKPRHPHRGHLLELPTRRALTTLAVAFAVVFSGCYQQPEPPRHFVPGDPLYEQFTTRGDRIVLDADDEHLAIKIRRRRHTTRVYDTDMIPVGQVRVDGDEVERRTLDGLHRATAQWVDDETVELCGAWRLEKTDQGWDVFDSDATVVALLRQDDDQEWILRPTRGELITLSVDTDDHSTRVVDTEGRTIIEADADHFSSISLLLLAIDELSPLDRYSLAAWSQLHL